MGASTLPDFYDSHCAKCQTYIERLSALDSPYCGMCEDERCPSCSAMKTVEIQPKLGSLTGFKCPDCGEVFYYEIPRGKIMPVYHMYSQTFQED